MPSLVMRTDPLRMISRASVYSLKAMMVPPESRMEEAAAARGGPRRPPLLEGKTLEVHGWPQSHGKQSSFPQVVRSSCLESSPAGVRPALA